ncbi:MAG: S-methyl-5-thioribose kinase [Sulfuricurvum sp.]|uniref:S-methyl-5-thioribose kinase n=1 Tax=Sulfuricurvum sp. TaxID=2025608 RepID=UPI0025EDC34C|nr:S-methyl-5-thioribose kinase [Sulfuricurvum sp.]MCK9373424.1 S-methyl-5-thioribose kinase [Sulfuricurvum sp.]
MEYTILDNDKVRGYIQDTPELMAILGEGELSIQEVGDGNLNYVYIVESSKSKIILKQAVPYLRIAGEGWPLSRERMNYEIRALSYFREIAPSFIPTIYHANEEMSVVALRFLENHIIMRRGLMEGIRYPKFAEQITDFLAASLLKSSSLYLSSESKRALMDRFNTNTQLCKISEDFIFTFPYMEHDSNNINPKMVSVQKELQNDTEFKVQMLKLKYLFMNQSDALLHGDLHTGSIMLNKDETYVIDPEFAFFGPFGFDIGALIANLLQSYVSHFERTRDSDYQQWLLETVEAIFVKFEAKFLDHWNRTDESALIAHGYADEAVLASFQKQFMEMIFRQSVGFAGAKMARRLFGIAGVEDITGIDDPDARARVEKKSLAIAKRFVKEYEKIGNVKELIGMIKQESE